MHLAYLGDATVGRKVTSERSGQSCIGQTRENRYQVTSATTPTSIANA